MAKNKTKKHEFELYSYETFMTLLEYEIKRAKRYNDPISLVRISVQADGSDNGEPQHGLEVFTINVLNLQLRDVDIPCRIDNEFLILMPCTDETGGRVVCSRLEKFFQMEAEVYEKVSMKFKVYLGLVSLPTDNLLTSKKLIDGAARAISHARENNSEKTIILSELEK